MKHIILFMRFCVSRRKRCFYVRSVCNLQVEERIMCEYSIDFLSSVMNLLIFVLRENNKLFYKRCLVGTLHYGLFDTNYSTIIRLECYLNGLEVKLIIFFAKRSKNIKFLTRRV